MRLWVIGVIFLSTWPTPGFAQAIANRTNLGPLLSRLDPKEGERRLTCDVEPVKPSLSFGFRFRAGYIFRVPLTQYSGARHRWSVVTEITP